MAAGGSIAEAFGFGSATSSLKIASGDLWSRLPTSPTCIALKNSKYFQKIPELSEEPKPESFCDFHLYGTEYDDTEKYHKGKIIYRFPKVNDVETSKKIANLLAEYNISKDQLQILLEYNQKESIRLRENNTRPWNLENIYKFSWIFNKPIEELLAIDYHE